MTDLSATVARFGLEDSVINESERPWIQSEKLPFMRWSPVRFDVARGAWTFIVHITTSGVVGRHQHHGDVFAYVLEGSWRYAEYDWVAETGAWTFEFLSHPEMLTGNHSAVVEAGKLYLVSDNRLMHQDSRDFGLVDSSTCEHIVFRLWGERYAASTRRFNVLW